MVWSVFGFETVDNLILAICHGNIQTVLERGHSLSK